MFKRIIQLFVVLSVVFAGVALMGPAEAQSVRREWRCGPVKGCSVVQTRVCGQVVIRGQEKCSPWRRTKARPKAMVTFLGTPPTNSDVLLLNDQLEESMAAEQEQAQIEDELSGSK